jgi:nitroimidazol reductase NimA-like FMN-containing flavoprotein (pyridoxamine 5'-phosphate oxidase superfamily)
MKFNKSEEAFLKTARVMRVATCGEHGPHVVPVCPVFDRGSIYFGADKVTKKIEHLERDPRTAVVFDEYSDDWNRICGVMIQGRAEFITGGPQFRRIRDLLFAKFEPYKQETLPQDESLVVRVIPEHKTSWGLD